jgi:hypothetical protein
MPGFNIAGYGGDLVSTLEPARAHRWVIQQLGPITQRGAMLVAKELNLPQWKTERIEILGTTLWYKFAKNVKWDDIQVTFYDIPQPEYSAFDEINKWRDLVHTNKTGILKHGGNGYKRDCVFQEQDGKGESIRNIRLKNAWPASMTWGKLSYVSTDLKIIDLTLSYDWAEVFK